MGVCHSSKGAKHQRHLNRSETLELDMKVREFLNKDRLREETIRKSTTQTFEDLFGATTTSWEDIHKLYKIDSKIGKGHFGEVRKASLYSQPGKKFAIKVINKKSMKKDLHLLKRELDIMRSLDHPNIIKFYEAYQDMNSFYLTMECCTGGELVSYLDKSGGLPEKEAKRLMSQILSAVIHLHDRGIAHRDLKPDNFLFASKNSEKRELKLIDFGLSKQTNLSGENNLKTILGTPYFVAPEVLTKPYSTKCDLWSCGVILYVMLSGTFPFFDPRHNEKTLFEMILCGNYQMSQPVWKDISKQAKHLISNLLEPDAVKRISARVALSHPWFDDLHAEEKAKNKEHVSIKTIDLLRNFKMNKTKMQQEVIKIIVNMMKPKDYIPLKAAFQYIDHDHSGFLTPQEILDVMKELGYEDGEEQIREMIANISMGDKMIGYIEFIAATMSRSVYMDKDRLWSAFKYIDVDNSGVITSQNIKECFARFGRKLMDKDVEELIQEVDIRGDHRISWEEFQELMKITNLESNSFSPRRDSNNPILFDDPEKIILKE